MFFIIRHVADFLERRVDKALISTGESLKIFVQEVWRLFFRVFVFFVTILLGFLHKPAFEKWVQEHRNRIQPIFVSPESENPERKHKEPTAFASLLNEESSSEPSSSPEEDAHQSSEEEILAEVNAQTSSSGASTAAGGSRLSPSTSSPRNVKRRRLKYEKLVHTNDRVFSNQKLNRGFLEDLRMWFLLRIDLVVNWFRAAFHQFFDFWKSLTLFGALNLLLRSALALRPDVVFINVISFLFRIITGFAALCINLPMAVQRFFTPFPVDRRTTRDLVVSQGYPYERYDVVTDDGYILQLERLPQPKSSKVLYFQHGVVDNSFAWFGHIEGEAASALAFRAFDEGYDVFVGTLRGCGGSTGHTNPQISPEAYWDFTVNEHAFCDIASFVQKIQELKRQDLNVAPEEPPKHKLTFIAHSMGAMATLMYLVYSRLKQKDHGVSSAILLSPAGYHKTAPRLAKLCGPIIDRFLRIFPRFSVFRFPSETFRVLASKLIEDLNNSYTGRIFVGWMISKTIGGNLEDHTFVNMHNLTYNIFTGTSKGIFKHFWQNWLNQRFEAFDYGKEGNLKHYGTEAPINFMENYDQIDVPIYFVMGLNDTLIEPISVITQYAALKDRHPDRAFLKAFSRLGHIDFTVGANEKLVTFLMNTLKNFHK